MWKTKFPGVGVEFPPYFEPGVEFKSVGMRVNKNVGVEFEILLTCLGCGYAMPGLSFGWWWGV